MGSAERPAGKVWGAKTQACGMGLLELGIGTGRVALPLAARGIRVDGVDVSPAMIAKLYAKPEGDQILATMGDVVDFPVRDTYRLVFVVFNTLFTEEDTG